MSYTPTEWESTDVVTATRMNALETAVGEMNMSYTPNTWLDGDILSAEKMNALEQAVASGGGGGGSSDFSTAEVTIVNNTVEDVDFYLINEPIVDHIIQEGGLSAMNILSSGLINDGTVDIGADGNSTEIFKFVLVNGYNFAIGGNTWQAEVPSNISVSGNAEKSYVIEQGQNYGSIFITGDCTITISAGQ